MNRVYSLYICVCVGIPTANRVFHFIGNQKEKQAFYFIIKCQKLKKKNFVNKNKKSQRENFVTLKTLKN